MTEIRRSANRSSGLPVPRPVKEWLRQEIVKIVGTSWIRIDGDLCQLARELLVEASQRPDFAAYSEACQTAALKSSNNMRAWLALVLRYEKEDRKVTLKGATRRIAPRVYQHTRTRIIDGRAVRVYTSWYVVVFRGSVGRAGLCRPGASPDHAVRLKIARNFRSEAEALDYEQRVREAIYDPTYKTPEEKVAAAHRVPLRRAERSQ